MGLSSQMLDTNIAKRSASSSSPLRLTWATGIQTATWSSSTDPRSSNGGVIESTLPIRPQLSIT